MDFMHYVLFSIAYIMFTRFGLLIAKWFNHVMFIIYFVLGGFIGWYIESYLTGFFLAVVLSLILVDDVAS